jgi:hypothetical protein
MQGASAWRGAGERARLRVRGDFVSGKSKSVKVYRGSKAKGAGETPTVREATASTKRKRAGRMPALQGKSQKRRPEASGTKDEGNVVRKDKRKDKARKDKRGARCGCRKIVGVMAGRKC